ncbi:phosphopantetheine adenylyltransferase [Clostridia bacterium]|nr:phosphopantetheine adenylyltransferase [Clostridia bacterium]
MSTAIYPGSFDPPTVGHVDIIQRAADLFDNVIVVCMVNARKRPTFSLEERKDMLRAITTAMPNVRVDSHDGLLVSYARDNGADVIVKGLRAMSDFETEFQMALLNRKQNPKLDTLFLAAGERFQYLNSSAVKEIGLLGGDISDFVPQEIRSCVTEKLRGGR